MKLSDLLDNRAITTNLRARDKRSALRQMVEILYKTSGVKDPYVAFKALLDHEAIDIISQGVVFPHARIDGLKEPAAVLAISSRKIPGGNSTIPGTNSRDDEFQGHHT